MPIPQYMWWSSFAVAGYSWPPLRLSQYSLAFVIIRCVCALHVPGPRVWYKYNYLLHKFTCIANDSAVYAASERRH